MRVERERKGEREREREREREDKKRQEEKGSMRESESNVTYFINDAFDKILSACS